MAGLRAVGLRRRRGAQKALLPRLPALRDERGMALVLAVGMTAVLSLVLGTVIDYSSANSRNASYSKSAQLAYTLAQAGLNSDAAVVANPANNPLDPTLLPARTSTYEGGSVSWSGTLNATTWTITATGIVRNPTGPQAANVTRTLTATLTVQPALTQPLGAPAWNYIFATRTGTSCDEPLTGENLNLSSPLYASGNLCLSGENAVISGSPLVVKGKLTISGDGSAKVGSSSSPIGEAHIAQGCQWLTNPLHNPCQYGAGSSGGDNVWSAVLDSNATTIAPPVADFASWYANADPGPSHACTTSSGTAPTFDNNSVRDNSVSTVFNLTPASSYTCKTARGELSWNASTLTLTVKGVVYIDGSATAANGAVDQYAGQGSLYLSGTFVVGSNTRLCAVVASGDCDFSTWNPNSQLLAIAADGSGGQAGSGNGVNLGENSSIQAAIYATNAITVGENAHLEAPMVAPVEYFSGENIRTYPWPSLVTVPLGLGGNPNPNQTTQPLANYSG